MPDWNKRSVINPLSRDSSIYLNWFYGILLFLKNKNNKHNFHNKNKTIKYKVLNKYRN